MTVSISDRERLIRLRERSGSAVPANGRVNQSFYRGTNIKAFAGGSEGEKKNSADDKDDEFCLLFALHRAARYREESAAFSRRASQKEDQQGESALFSKGIVQATGRRVTRATRARRDFRTAIQHPGRDIKRRGPSLFRLCFFFQSLFFTASTLSRHGCFAYFQQCLVPSALKTCCHLDSFFSLWRSFAGPRGVGSVSSVRRALGRWRIAAASLRSTNRRPPFDLGPAH